MLHRDKIIGKSLYRIVKHTGESFRIMEIFNDGRTLANAYSKRQWQRVDDALLELQHIDRERYYTDPFKTGGFNV